MDKVKAEEVWFYIQKNFIIIDIFVLSHIKANLMVHFAVGGKSKWEEQSSGRLRPKWMLRHVCVCVVCVTYNYI